MYHSNKPLQEENEEAPHTKNNEIKMKQVLETIYNKHWSQILGIRLVQILFFSI